MVIIYDRLACGSLPDINNSRLAAPQSNVLITGVVVPGALEHHRVSQALLLTLTELMKSHTHLLFNVHYNQATLKSVSFASSLVFPDFS